MRIETTGGNRETQPGRTLIAASDTTFPSSIRFTDSEVVFVNLKNSNLISPPGAQNDGSIKLSSNSIL